MGSDKMESRPDSSSSKKTHVVSDDGFFVSPDDLMAERRAQREKESMAMGRPESPDSDVSLKSDWSKAGLINFKDRVFLRLADFSSSEEEDVSDDEGFFEPPDDLMDTRRLEAIDSGVSFKSDRSKDEPTDFKDRVSPRLADFSSSEEEDVSDDEGFFEPPDDLEEMNQELSSEVGWKHLEAPVSSCS